MNILFLLTNYPGFGGIEKVTTYITSYLYNKGYNISILAYGVSAPSLIASLPKGIILNFVPELTNYVSRKNIEYIKEYLEEHDFDFVVYQDSYAPTEHLFNEIDYPWNKKLIVVEHNSPLSAFKSLNGCFYYKQGLKFLITRILKYPYSICVTYIHCRKRHSMLFHKCRRYILLSETFKRELKYLIHHMDEKKILSIANPLTITCSFKSYLALKKKQILFVGRLTDQKGINFLLPIWKEFSKYNKDGWNLVILGEGPKKEYVETYINKEHLEKVSLCSPTLEIEKYYEESSILVLTSIFEGFGLVLTEAMSRGCIPIAFDSFKSVHDIIENGINGFLIQPYNLKQYVSCLVNLTNDDVKFRSMAQTVQTSIKKFDLNIIGSCWNKLFLDLSK